MENKIKNIVKECMLAGGIESENYLIFCGLLDCKTVGVMGDSRTYSKPVFVEILENDGLAAVELPYNILDNISNRITNEIPNTNRVVWDITKLYKEG